MSDISEDAYLLLKTARKRGLKVWGGKIFDNAQIATWYSEDEDDDNWIATVRLLLAELLAAKLIEYEDRDDPDDTFRITPKGEDYSRSSTTPPSIIQSFSNIHGSNIANISPHTRQTLDLGSYSSEVQGEVAELQDAFEAKDKDRAKRIIDGLWVSAPQLILSLIQIALGVNGGAK